LTVRFREIVVPNKLRTNYRSRTKKDPPSRWTVGQLTGMRAAMERAAQHRYALPALM
jgi:hypothetical protein